MKLLTAVMLSLHFIFFACSSTTKSYDIVVAFRIDELKSDQLKEEEENGYFFYGQAFINASNEITKNKQFYYITINLPDSMRVSKDSQFLSGYVDFLGTRGIKIEPGTVNKSLSQGDTVQGIYSKEIIIINPKTDSTLSKGVLDAMRYLIHRQDSVNNKTHLDSLNKK